MGRILALDFGVKRTGIAVTDELRLIASGLTTVATKEIIPFLNTYLESENVDIFVVGEPKQMNNTPSESEEYIQPFLTELSKHFPQVGWLKGKTNGLPLKWLFRACWIVVLKRNIEGIRLWWTKLAQP